ncbi:MAG: heme exporter protein CcmB [Gammaproteobacteria bacterium]
MSVAAGLTGFTAVVRRDLVLYFRRRSEIANPLLFFVMVVTLFPLGVGPEPDRLASVAPGVVWVAALLAAMLSLETIFRSDFDDGSLEQLVISPQPLSLLVLAKVLAHWVVSGLPLVVLGPFLGGALFLPAKAMWTLVLTLALGTPVLSLVGAIGVALVVGLRRGGVLLSLLVLPLYVPVLVFGASAVHTAASGLPVGGPLALLGAMLALAVTLGPPATAAALRISLS